MVFAHFNQSVPLLPTPQQILEGLILGQVEKLKQIKLVNTQIIVESKIDLWTKIFSLAKTIDMKKPLTHKILSNPDHDFVKILVYIYSMESFVYKEVNNTSRVKDFNKIKYYGAFASALGYIVHCGNQKNKKGCAVPSEVYRGVRISPEALENTYKMGSTLTLKGFTSTTLSIETACKFAFANKGDINSRDK